MQVNQFKKGDIITRLRPMTYLNQSNGGSFMDDRFVGQSVTFMGLANGMMYGVVSNDEETVMVGLVLHQWDDNEWEYYIDPRSLLEEENYTIVNKLQIELFEAELSQDFERCSEIHEKIKAYKQNPGSAWNYPNIKIVN